MAGLIGDLLSSSDALTRHSASLNVIGDNIANVNNSDYSRKTVATESYSGPGGAVYTKSSVVSSRDSIADRQVIEETSDAGAFEAKKTLYSNLNNVMSESLNGSLGTSLSEAQAEGTGITGGLTTFFNNWSSYAASPNASASQGELYTNAQDLASRFNAANKALDDAQGSLNDSLDSNISKANALLSKIATLNSEIVSMEARESGSASDLADTRQAAMEDLAKIVNFSSTTEDNGSVTLTLPSSTGGTGQTLVSGGNAATFAATKNSDGDYTGITSTFKGSTSSISPTGGTLSVLNPTVTTAAIKDARDKLDAVAKQLISSTNAIYGKSSSDGKATFFTGTGAGDIALSSDVAKASDIKAGYASSVDGSNDLANDMASLLKQSFSKSSGDSVDGTLTSSVAGIATDIASKLNEATDASSQQNEMLSLVTTNRNNISGASTDEEMSNLIVTQHAYQASARILSTVNTLLDLVTTRLGA
jgi:flagellar hook-associated protein 1 FlgK